MSKKKILIIVGVVVVVAVLVYINIVSSTVKTTEVLAEKATELKLIETVSASGRIQPQTKVDITSEVTGEIIALRQKEGNYVNEGQLLIILDTVQLQSDLDQAKYSVSEIEARLEGSKATLEQTKQEYDREQALMEKKQTSEKIYELAKYAFLNASASYNAMQAQAQQSRARLDKQLDYLSKAKIVAPMSGIITYVDCEVGEIAPAQTAFTQGRTLMTISNLDVFEVEVEVDETEINKIELAQIVDIEVDAFTDTIFAGEVVEIGNTAIVSGIGSQEQSTNFKVKVIFNDPNVKIRPGMSATVDIITNSNEKALAIPYSAVVMRSLDLDSLERAKSGEEVENEEVESDGELLAAENDETDTDSNTVDKQVEREEVKGVYVIREGIAEFVTIETGIADQKNIEITEGLIAGDSVISGPYRVLRTIKNGDAVKVEKKGK